MSKAKSNPPPAARTMTKTAAAAQAARASLLESDFAPVAWTLYAGLAFLAGLIFLIARCYHPDTQALLREATELVTPKAARDLAPESVEHLQFLASVLLTPMFLLGCLFVLRRLFRAMTETQRRLAHWLALAVLFAGTVGLPVFTYHAMARADFLYVKAGVLFNALDSYLLFIFPVLAVLWFFSEKRWVGWLGKAALYGMSVVMALLAIGAVVFDRDNIAQWTYHLNPVIYPLAQVLAGKTLLVNCAPLYGLYPQFLQPLFSLCPLSVFSFTVLMASLLVISLAGIWFFLRTAVKNDYVFLVGFVAAVFYSHAPAKMMISEALRPDPYFQYAPVRSLFPCLLLALAALYLRGVRKQPVYYLTYLCCTLGTLWNFDSGIAVFGAWVLLLGYTELSDQPWRAAAKAILRHALVGVGCLVLVYGGYAVFARLRSGQWPNFQMTATYYKLFSHYGYFMLPMPRLPHLWGLMVLVFALGLVLALNGLFRKEDRVWCGSLFLLAILGTGLFAYYQGRSHDQVAIPLLYVPILMITLMADKVLGAARSRNAAAYKFVPLAALCMFFCASAVPSVFAQSGRFKQWLQVASSARPGGAQGVHSKNIAFIRQHTTPRERIFILLPGELDGMYHAESSTACALDLPSSNDWFFKKDIEQVVGFLQTNRTAKVFTVPGQYADLSELFQKSYRMLAQEPQTGLAVFQPAESAPAPGKP